MLSALAITLCCLALVQSNTVRPHTHHHGNHATHTGPTHEPNEKDNLLFFYDHLEHSLLIHSGHACYIATLSPDEQISVHSDAGIRDLEVKLIAQMSSATPVDGSSLSNHTQHLCGKHTVGYYTIS